jgi:hypothetical protein
VIEITPVFARFSVDHTSHGRREFQLHTRGRHSKELTFVSSAKLAPHNDRVTLDNDVSDRQFGVRNWPFAAPPESL